MLTKKLNQVSVLDNQKVKTKGKLRLDVGCGFNKQYGYIGIDKRKDISDVDIVHDIENFPWPLRDESCEVILMSHIVEHIKPWLQIDLINECWRLLIEDGILMIATPYGTSFGYMQDPTHISPWNEATPTYFIKGQKLYEIYRPKPWRAESNESVTWDTHGTLEITLRKIKE